MTKKQYPKSVFFNNIAKLKIKTTLSPSKFVMLNAN